MSGSIIVSVSGKLMDKPEQPAVTLFSRETRACSSLWRPAWGTETCHSGIAFCHHLQYPACSWMVTELKGWCKTFEMDAFPEVHSLLQRLAAYCGYLGPSCSPEGVVPVAEGVPQQWGLYFLSLPPGADVSETGHGMLAFVQTVSIFCISGKGAWLFIPYIFKKVLCVALRESRIMPYPRKGFLVFSLNLASLRMLPKVALWLIYHHYRAASQPAYDMFLLQSRKITK